MAGSNQIAHRIDDGGDTPEPSKSLGQTPDSPTAKSLKDKDAEWGYEPGKGGMAVEAKMGMCIVLILVCAFSFLVYHKYDLKQKALAMANIALPGKDKPVVTDALEVVPSDRFAEFNTTDPEPSLMAGSTLSQDGAPSFAGGTVEADVARPTFDSPDRLLADAGSLDTQFEMSEPALEPQPARDLLATRELEPEPFDAFSEPKFDTGPAATFGESFAVSDLASQPTEPLISEPESEIAGFEPTSLQPAVDEPAAEEPAFVAFGEPQPVQRQEFAEPAMVADPPAADSRAAYTPLPPVRAEPFDAFDTPSTEPFFDRPVAAVKDFSPTPDPFEEFAPLAIDEPKPVALLEDEVVSSSFEPDPLPAAVDAELTPAAVPQPFTGFQAEPVVAAATEETSPLRRPAPMPEFDYNDPAPVPAPDAATVAELVELDRHDTLVAMTTPAPDVDVFDPEPPVAPDAVAPVANRFLQEPRKFGAEPSGFGSLAQAEAIPSGGARRAAPPELVPFPAADVGSRLSIPAPPADGVAQFVVPPVKTVQQVSGISEQCDICEVQPDDNYWRISQRVYGTARYFSSLALYNQHRIPDPKKLRPGMKVMIPDPKLLEQKYPEFFKSKNAAPKAPRGFFVTSNGSPAYRIGDRETLSAISQKHLGRASRWIQIYRMNQNILKDPNKLKPGTVIALPDDATSVHLAP